MADSKMKAAYPIELAPGVYECGFNSIRSANGRSYFIVHPHGNWLVNTPQFLPELLELFTKLGGVQRIFLTHRDDVGECEQYAKHFKAKRLVHMEDQEAQLDAEIIFDNRSPFSPQEDFLVIPNPGHTEGHCMLLFKTFLISGDSLYFDKKHARLDLWGPYWTWQDFDLQVRSAEELLQYDFEWLLPIHGDQVHLSVVEMKQQLQAAIARARVNPEREELSEDQVKKLDYYIRELNKLGQHAYATKMQEKRNELQSKLTLLQSS